MNALQVMWSACRIEDERALVEYNIKTKSTLHFVPGLRGGMQIFVRTLSSKTIKLEADSNRLHEACMEEYEGLAKLLLQHGADADVRYKESLRTNSLRTKHHDLVKPYRVQDVRE